MTRIELERDPKAGQYVLLLEDVVKDERDRPLLSKRCAGLDELDNEIVGIKAKLDEIQKQSRKRWGSA